MTPALATAPVFNAPETITLLRLLAHTCHLIVSHAGAMCAYDQCVRRRLGALAVSLTAVSVLAGCASGSVDKNLTDAKARDQIYSHLRRTLAALPEGTTFSLSSDSRRGPFDPGYTSVCSNSDGATPENTPVKVQIVYWVNGVPNGKQAGYIDRITKLWKSLGMERTAGGSNGDGLHHARWIHVRNDEC